MNDIIELPLYLQNKNKLFFKLSDDMKANMQLLSIFYKNTHNYDPNKDYRNNMIKTVISDIDLENENDTSLIESLAAICCKKIKTKNQQTALNLLNLLELGILEKSQVWNSKYIIEIWAYLTYKNRNFEAFRVGYRKFPVNVYKKSKNKLFKTRIYSAPRYKEVPKLMNDLCYFLNNWHCDIDDFYESIVKSIILSAYFVYVHPFLDGNGRTSRLLMNKFLVDNGLSKFRYLSINAEISKNKAKYNDELKYIETNNTGDITSYIEYMLSVFISLFEHVSNPNRRELDYKQLSKRERKMLEIIKSSNQGFTLKEYKKYWNAIAKQHKYPLIDIKEAEKDVTHLFRLDFIVADERYVLYPGFKYYNK